MIFASISLYLTLPILTARRRCCGCGVWNRSSTVGAASYDTNRFIDAHLYYKYICTHVCMYLYNAFPAFTAPTPRCGCESWTRSSMAGVTSRYKYVSIHKHVFYICICTYVRMHIYMTLSPHSQRRHSFATVECEGPPRRLALHHNINVSIYTNLYYIYIYMYICMYAYIYDTLPLFTPPTQFRDCGVWRPFSTAGVASRYKYVSIHESLQFICMYVSG